MGRGLRISRKLNAVAIGCVFRRGPCAFGEVLEAFIGRITGLPEDRGTSFEADSFLGPSPLSAVIRAPEICLCAAARQFAEQQFVGRCCLFQSILLAQAAGFGAQMLKPNGYAFLERESTPCLFCYERRRTVARFIYIERNHRRRHQDFVLISGDVVQFALT